MSNFGFSRGDPQILLSTISPSCNTKILDLPPEIHVEIATYLGTIKNLANFKMSCSRIYNSIESEKVDRKRLPHLKIESIEFGTFETQTIELFYRQKNGGGTQEEALLVSSDPLSIKLHILIQHWILKDNCKISLEFSTLKTRLIESLWKSTMGMQFSAKFAADLPIRPNIKKCCLFSRIPEKG